MCHQRCHPLVSANPGSTDESADSPEGRSEPIRRHGRHSLSLTSQGSSAYRKKHRLSAKLPMTDSYVSDLVTGDAKTSKKLWTFVKGKRCDSSGVSPLKKDGIAYSDPKIKATLLNEQFSSDFTKADKANAPSLGKSPYPDVQAFDVHNNWVQKLLQNLNPHKASGPDNIPSRLLKETAAEIAPALTLLFQSSLQQGEVPENWKLANVTPLFKKGDKNDASNYRPISLTSVCSKLLEHILHSQIMKHLENHTILTDQQHGFRKQRSCESQLS